MEAPKLVLKLKKAIWRNFAASSSPPTADLDTNNIADPSSESSERDSGRDSDDTAPRKRKIPGSAFNPSACAQCGTGTTCNRCRSLSVKAPSVDTDSDRKSSKPSLVAKVSHGAPKQSKSKTAHKASERESVLPSSPRPSTQQICLPISPVASSSADSNCASEESEIISAEHLFRFIDEFLTKCPSDILDSPVQLNPGEIQMTPYGNLTYRELASHLSGLRIEHIHRLLRGMLQKLMQNSKNGDVFNVPVDPVALNLPTYFSKIKKPMDLGTIKTKLQRGEYRELEAAVADIRLVFDNALLFNPPNNAIHEIAKALKQEFEADYVILKEKLEKEAERKASHSCSLCQRSCCLLCGEKCLRVEPPILVCYGPCGQRVKKNCVYYVSRDGLMLWCQKCHSGLPSVACEAMGNSRSEILKKDLLKRRLDEEVAESWVRCDTCERWVHQVCTLYNDRYESMSKEDLSWRPNTEDATSLSGPPSSFSSSTPIAIKDHGVVRSKMRRRHDNGFDSAGAHGKFECVFCKLKHLLSVYDTTSIADSVHSRSRKRASTYTDDTYVTAKVAKKSPSSTASIASGKTSLESKSPKSPSLIKIPEIESPSSKAASPSDRILNTEHSVNSSVDASAGIKVETTDKDGPKNRSQSLEENVVRTPMRSPKHSVKPADPLSFQWRSSALPQTKIGAFLESLIRVKLISEGFPEAADTIYVRMVSNTSHRLEVPSAIQKNFPSSDGFTVPTYIPYRQKCILLFQNIDGLDVCLFTLYVQEFDADCPEPNKSRVYIAYLDSVEYLRPRSCRTKVYHELLAGYLKWCQFRGFKHCHIWACPPQRGDNFIFWCHPPHQRTPSRDRLTLWYNQMLKRAQAMGVYSADGGLSNLWSYSFSKYAKRDEGLSRQASKVSLKGMPNTKGKNSKSQLAVSMSSANLQSSASETTTSLGPICPPVFEGDLWVNECLRVYKFFENQSKNAKFATQLDPPVPGGVSDKFANQRNAREILRQIMVKPQAYAFLSPVDPVALNIPDYPLIIKNPMDLGTIRDNLRAKKFASMFEFLEAIRLTFDNAMLFNPPTHPIHQFAAKFKSDVAEAMVTYVINRVGPQATPIPDAANTDGDLDFWLKQLILPCEPSGKSTSKVASNDDGQEASSKPRTIVDMYEISTSAAEHSRTEFGLSIDEACTTEQSCDSRDVMDSVGPTLGEEEDSHSSPRGDSTVYASNSGDAENVPLWRDYPAPVGFCRQDSSDNFMGSMDRDPAVAYANTCGADDATSPTGDNDNSNWSGVRMPMSTLMGSMMSSPNPSADEPYDSTYNGNAGLVLPAAAKPQEVDAGVPSMTPFEAPVLGVRVAMSLMNELSKATLRFKEDLFVVSFTTRPALTREDDSIDLEAVRKWLDASGLDGESLAPCFDGVYLSHETADPDPIMHAPFVDTRHTFLEMCQYRHYQFDSLRRAKYSSMMLLFHLHRPRQSSLRPRCVSCKHLIKDVRWHCELCDSFDLCCSCTSQDVGVLHPHPLIPFRVSYL